MDVSNAYGDIKPVIFTFSLQNYKTISGFRLDDENWTSHIADKEYLLKDGMKAFVLDVQEVEIKDHEVKEGEDSSECLCLLKELEGKSVTFIHLCRLG